MFANDENAFYYNGLTREEWEKARRRIMRRAEAARAQALRDLAGAVLRLVHTLVAAVATVAGKWWRAYLRRRDRTLKDIGINRSEIESVVDRRDDTRLRDATIAANRSRRRDPTAGTGMTSRPQPSPRQLIKKHAA